MHSFFERSGGLARGTGFLARFLIAWPASTQGSRFFTEPPLHWPALAAFNQQIVTILEKPVVFDKSGALAPNMLPLAADAKTAWVAFHDSVERGLANDGELYDVRDVASKAADNAARLAALFQVFENSENTICLEAFVSASRIAAWHLNEARRFFGELALPAEITDAVKLDFWLLNHCRKNGVCAISRRALQRHVPPAHLRQKAALEGALRELAEAGRLRLVQEGAA